MNEKTIEMIKTNTKSITLLEVESAYRVEKRDGLYMQYWYFKTIKEALDKLNEEAVKIEA